MRRLLLSPGPVEIDPKLNEVASRPLPYFRGDEFAAEMKELTEDVRELFQTKATPITLASSGSGAMEMALQNLFDDNDKVVVIQGGSFGKKWITMCRAYNLEVIEVALEYGSLPDLEYIDSLLTDDIKALFVNMHETSTGLLYDIEALGKITKHKNKLFVVDGISSIGADEFMMDKWNCDCAMVSSNKALACMPGLSFIAFSDRALEVVKQTNRPRYYFDAMDYLNNIPRGMTPFTPAMNIILQVKAKLQEIKKIGIRGYNDQHLELASYFRNLIVADRDFQLFGENRSSALSTIVLPDYMDSRELIEFFRKNYKTELAPVPLNLTNIVRVSHMGYITKAHMKEFVKNLFEYKKILLSDKQK